MKGYVVPLKNIKEKNNAESTTYLTAFSESRAFKKNKNTNGIKDIEKYSICPSVMCNVYVLLNI